MAVANESDFHTAVHNSIGTPKAEYKTSGHRRILRRKKINKVHVSDWATSQVRIKSKTISIQLYLDFQKNSLSDKDYKTLVGLASKGIQKH